MPPSSSSAAPVDPIELLSQQIAPAAKRKGSIKLATNLVNAVKLELETLRASKNYVLDASINTLVYALDNNEKTCSRLDSATFGIILQTLLHAKYSRQKERGILLLTASLHHDAHKTPPLRTIKARKVTIGKECLHPLLSCFTNTLENPQIRRWVGVLILQLLEGTDHNRMTFEAGPEDSKRKLGTMVIEEHNEILRITCGQLFKGLMAWNIPPEDLWPVGTDPMHYKNFPAASQSQKHWNNAFQAYVDEIFDTSKPSQEGSGRLYFAQALVVSPMASKISGGIITIFVDRDISICTQSSDISFTESLEIPFQLISEAKIEATLLEGATSSATPPVDLVVELKISGKVSCYMNALPVNIGGLRITVRDRGLARFIGDEFLNPRHFKKASQSKETIAIAPGFYNAVSPQESEVVGDSNEEGTKFRHDPAITRPREKSQNDVQNVEFNNFIEESPQDNQTRETDTQPNLELGEFVAEGADSAARPIYEDNQDVAVDPVRFRSSAPARLSHRSGNDIAASVDKEENMRQDIDLPNHASKRTLRGKAHLRPSVLKPTVPEPTPDEESQEMTEPPPSPVASPVESTQQKAKSARLNAEVNPEDEKKTLLKPAIPKGETKRAKKYSLKPKAAAPITKTAASKRATALRARATVSKAGPKVSDSKLAAVPKPNPTSKGIPAPAAKAPKKKISKLLVPKKLALKDIPKLPTRQFQTHQSELNLKSQEMETAPTSPKSLVAMSLDLDAQRSLMQEGKATDRHASRLSAALADIEDIEHQDASFGELVQTSLIYQPPNVTTQTESSSSPVLRRTATPAQEEHSPGQFLLELMPVLSKNCANQPPQGSMRSESSPSSLVRVTPVPLPAQEESPAECFIQEATSVPSKILAGYIGPRRSPRLASHYSIREASVALGRVRAVAPCPARKPAVIDLSDNDEPKCQDGGSDDDSPSRADEIPLFDDYLARKTPLVSFGAKGPRNQGIPSLKKCSLQRVEEPENRPLLIQTYMPTQRGKRKRAKEDAPMVENNKRQQNYRLQKSMDKKPEATKVLPLAFRDAEDLIMPRNRPAARNTARFGSQGSRVNENGSPRGHSNNFQEPASHNKIARKALRDVKPTEITGEDDGDGYFHYDDDSGLNMVDNDQGFLLDPPVILYSEGEGPSMREGHQPVYDYATSSSSFKVRPLSPCPDEEVVKRHLPRKKNTNFQDPKVGTKVVHHQQGKLADPFLKESPEIDLSSFARRLQYRQQTPTRKIRDDPTAPTPRKTRYTMNEDPEVTLVNAENEIQVRELSSSSDMTSESSDEAQNPRSHKVALEVHQAQRDEWRMALKPHQRGILDVLNQVSTDLVRHLISHEQAVEDVLTEYEQGGTKLIKNLEKTHQDDRRRIQHELDKVKKTMGKEYTDARHEISRIAKTMRAQPVRKLEKEWMQEQDRMQKMVEESIRKCW